MTRAYVEHFDVCGTDGVVCAPVCFQVEPLQVVFKRQEKVFVLDCNNILIGQQTHLQLFDEHVRF